MNHSDFPVVLEKVSFAYEEGKYIFRDMSLELPSGVVSLVGRNGTGKSTLLLLAGGRLLLEKGSVRILGNDSIELKSEEERNSLVSFVYQNMEFETEESVGDLLSLIFESGFHEKKEPALLDKIIEVMDLYPVLSRKTGEISKGEMQRAVIAFSLLYGSKIIMMDEPVFAMENDRKAIILAYLNSYSREYDVTIYYSIHELDLSVKFSDNVLLFTKEGLILSGPTKELMTRENIEQAYQVPLDMLHQRENLYREHLIKGPAAEEMKKVKTGIIE